MNILKVVVGSENKAKLRAAESALKLLFPEQNIQIVGCKAASGVSDQPMSDEESIKGATERAKASLKMHPDACFAIGMEGGVHHIESIDKWFECGWIVVVSLKGDEMVYGIASTARFELPKSIMHEIIVNKKELAQIMDEVTGKADVRSNDGAMGILTNSLLKRDHIYSEAVIFAFSRFITPFFNNEK